MAWSPLRSSRLCSMAITALTGPWKWRSASGPENKVLFEGILLKPSMVTPGAESSFKTSPGQVVEYTLNMLKKRVPLASPGIMFLSDGQSEFEATLNLNAMNQDKGQLNFFLNCLLHCAMC